MDLLTDSELDDLESEAVLQCAIRGKLLKKHKKHYFIFFKIFFPSLFFPFIWLILNLKSRCFIDDPFVEMTEGQWEALNGLESNVAIAAENEQRELEDHIDVDDSFEEPTEGQWETLNRLESNVGIAAENERRELE